MRPLRATAGVLLVLSILATFKLSDADGTRPGAVGTRPSSRRTATSAVPSSTSTTLAGASSAAAPLAPTTTASTRTASTSGSSSEEAPPSPTAAPASARQEAPPARAQEVSAPRAAEPGIVRRDGTHLVLDGNRYRFTGFNAYHLASLPSRDIWGCGVESSDAELDAFFSSLRPNSVVRFWAFQRFAWNQATKRIDWTAIDRVVNAARKHGHRLVAVLADQYGDCYDAPWKNEAWYAGGYRHAFDNGEGSQPLSYWDWLSRIIPRYAGNGTIALWEPMSEPEAYTDSTRTVCSATAGRTLRAWYDTVGAEIKRLDPSHLISSATAGNGQCGAEHTDYERLHESPFIDVGSYHDYQDDASAFPGDQWNGLKVRIEQMNRIGKPLIVGEVGIKAGDVLLCKTRGTRRDQLRSKWEAQARAGIDGWLLWSWWPRDPGGCQYENVHPGDPAVTLVRNFSW